MIFLQVGASLLLVAAVLWYMWRLPRRGDGLFAWAPTLGLMSAWSGLLSLLATGCLWLLPEPDLFLPPVFLVLYPVAVGAGILVLWIYRPPLPPTVGEDAAALTAHRMQAWVGITLGLLATALGYLFVMTHKTPFTPIGQ